MDADFITLTPQNINKEHLCRIIRSKKSHPGVEAKRKRTHLYEFERLNSPIRAWRQKENDFPNG